MKPSELAYKAAAVLARRKGWQKGEYDNAHRRKSGKPDCFCTLGAVRYVASAERKIKTAMYSWRDDRPIQQAYRDLFGISPVAFNDDRCESQAEAVFAMLFAAEYLKDQGD